MQNQLTQFLQLFSNTLSLRSFFSLRSNVQHVWKSYDVLANIPLSAIGIMLYLPVYLIVGVSMHGLLYKLVPFE